MLAGEFAKPMFSMLGAPYYRRHPVRCSLIVACMGLTAAIHTGLSLGNASLQGVFQDMLDRVAGRTQIQVSNVGGVAETLLERLRALDCTSAAAATILRSVPVELPGETAIAVMGVDLLDDDRFRDYALADPDGGVGGFEGALVLLAQPYSVLVTRQLAERHNLTKGSALPVWTGRERRELVVRGLLEDTELTGAYGGNLAVMDLYAAQHVFSRRGLFDRIDLQVESDASVEGCAAAIRSATEGQFGVAVTARGGGSARTFAGMYGATLDASNLLALLAALMLIHHAATVGVAQREREIAILLALGASEKRIRRFVLAEAALAGALAGALGVAIGYAVAHPFAGALEGILRPMLGFELKPSRLEVSPLWAAGVMLTTAGVALIGAWGAAEAAGSVPPIQLAGGRRYSERTEPQRKAALGQAALLAAAAVLIQRFWTDSSALYVCFPLALAALWQLGRALERPLVRLTGALAAAIWPLAGSLVVPSLVRERRRLRGPLFAVAFAVAVVATILGATTSYAERFLAWASRSIDVDYVVHSGAVLSEQGAFFPPETPKRLLEADGVAQVARMRRMMGRAAGRRAKLFPVDLDFWLRSADLPPPSAPNSAVIGQNFASLAGLEQGDLFTIETPSGLVELRADHVIEDYMSEPGSVYFGWELYQKSFRTDAIEIIGVVLDASADRERAREQIAELLPPGAPVLIADPSQISAHIRVLVERWRRASSLPALAVVPIAMLAAGSFLIVSFLAKKQQLAVLEALGATRAQIRQCVWAEAVALGLAGSLLGLVSGALLELFVLDSIEQIVVGFRLPFRLDWRLVVSLLAAGPAGALLAAWVPLVSLGQQPLARELSSE